MSVFAYDLHMHSCLSPCAEDDMTPFSMAGMAKLNGLDMIALTDHNTCGNVRTFFQACRNYGVIPVAGMELTTSEDVHVVCILPNVEAAEAFEREVRQHRIPVKNRPEIFGNQLLIGLEDEVVGTEENLLINATDLDLSAAAELASRYEGAAYPAHIDRDANGIIAMLGEMPVEPYFRTVEFRDGSNIAEYERKYGLEGRRKLISSDAHRLWDMHEGEQKIKLPCSGENEEEVARALINYIRGV
jgi:hypothetical protein